MKIENRGGQNRLVHRNPFSNMNCEQTQYWLGLLAADGWIGRGIWLGLKELDMMEKYRDFISPNLKIHGLSKHHSTYRVGFQHKETQEYLGSLGIVPRKSLTLCMHTPITKHFFRGVFDGDGYSPKQDQSAKITSGSILFLQQLQSFLLLNNIDTSIKIQQRGKNITYALYITARHYVKFYPLLYTDATIYMKRKEERLRHYRVSGGKKLGELLGICDDNQQPSVLNDIKVDTKVQRLMIEESNQ